jgi:hypothetical protein
MSRLDAYTQSQDTNLIPEHSISTSPAKVTNAATARAVLRMPRTGLI